LPSSIIDVQGALNPRVRRQLGERSARRQLMVEEARSPEASSLASELDGALTTLETALADAGRCVADLRGNVAQVSDLTDLARRMDAAMARARENLSLPPPVSRQASEREADDEGPATAPPDHHTNGSPSHCFRLDVHSRGSPLDLKAVDGSVNEIPEVVDVALLNYDGHQATLKLWIDASANPDEAREALLQSLRRQLGDDGNAEIHIDIGESSAAA
jgi:hypothetical protein